MQLNRRWTRLLETLGLDPIEIRRINAIRKGGRTSYGQLVETEVSLIECLQLANQRAREMALQAPEGWKVGIGLAGLWKTTGISHGRDPGATAKAEINLDGKVLIKVNCHELGQGTATGLAQIASQVLELPLAQIQVCHEDSSLTPKGGPAIASRQTFVLGMAVYKAAQGLKAKILRLFEETDRDTEGQMDLAGTLSLDEKNPAFPWDKVFDHIRVKDIHLEASYQHAFPQAVAIPEKENGFENLRFDQSLTYGAHAAVVRVEESTGKIVVDRLIAVHDVGKVINPLLCRSQIVGGALMELGQTLNEDLNLRGGRSSIIPSVPMASPRSI